MKLLPFLKRCFTFVSSRLRKQRECTTSSGHTESSYLISSQDLYTKARVRQQNYIYDQLADSNDPLMQFIAATPIHTQYMTLAKAHRQGIVTMHWSGAYMSHHHLALFVLLHRLGLRGRKYTDAP